MSLIERLEAAEVGSRELDCLLAALIQGDGFKAVGEHVCGKGAFFSPERYTTSLDAALALAERVLPGWAFMIQREKHKSVAHVQRDGISIYWYEGGDDCGSYATGYSNTPALALCIAILKAKETK